MPNSAWGLVSLRSHGTMRVDVVNAQPARKGWPCQAMAKRMPHRHPGRSVGSVIAPNSGADIVTMGYERIKQEFRGDDLPWANRKPIAFWPVRSPVNARMKGEACQ